jgi:nitroimidazol reductase NimA-like FMN-containing flavoprotein (pyridoxamine 5'-phosphate oxidase superfamily)
LEDTAPKEFVESRKEMERLLHCAVRGSKLEIIRNNPNVCFTVSRHFGEMVSHPQGAKCHINSDSVICYGRARIIDNVEERCAVLNAFNRCLQPTAKEITLEEVEQCSAVEIVVDEMTGRSERDGKCTYWKQIAPNIVK